MVVQRAVRAPRNLPHARHVVPHPGTQRAERAAPRSPHRVGGAAAARARAPIAGPGPRREEGVAIRLTAPLECALRGPDLVALDQQGGQELQQGVEADGRDAFWRSVSRRRLLRGVPLVPEEVLPREPRVRLPLLGARPRRRFRDFPFRALRRAPVSWRRETAAVGRDEGVRSVEY